MNRRTLPLVVVGVACLAMVTSCGPTNKAVEPFNDAPIAAKHDGSADVYSMPDGFNNFAEKCDKYGNLVITTYHHDSPYGSVTAVKDGCK